MRLNKALQRSFNYLLQTAFILGALVFSPALLALEKVTSVRVWKAPDNTRLVFDLTGPVEHHLFTLQNPERVVIDLSNSEKTAALDLLDFKDGPVTNVRSAPQGGNQLRVVLDLNQRMQPKSFLLKPNEQYGHRLVIDLYPPAGQFAPAAQTPAQASKPRPAPAPGAGRDIVIAIDPGHGGDDPGAIGPSGLREKDVVMQIAKRVYHTLNAEKGIKPVLVRTGDYFMPLAARRETARKKHQADLFISIHADAFTNRKAHGASVFALSRSGATSTLARVLAEKENRSDLIGGVSLEDKDDMLASVLADLAMEGSMDHSLKVGGMVLGEMGQVTRLHKPRLEQAGFAVLKSADIPSILVETGFISNPGEEKKLRTEQHQTQLARAISKGVIRYFDQHPPPDSWFALRKQGGTLAQAASGKRQHRIERGETLSYIAQRYQVSLSSLMQHNALNDPSLVRVGQVLRIPNS